jgi:hypothetical protein
LRSLGVVAAAVALAAALADGARAAPWCGTTTTEDRPAIVTGRSIRVVYAIPSDGADRSAERAPQISADVDEIAAWWRAQDFEREPRFDRAAFACGSQADLVVVRLPENAAALQANETRFEKLTDALIREPGQSGFDKHLVYYDGPVVSGSPCGEGGGTADGAGIAIVYLATCAAVPTEVVATHELLHAFGALPASGPPNACPDSTGHPCDSSGDILYPYAPAARLAALALDVGRNDYYAHPAGWLDVQDSAWLRLVTRQIRLALTIAGGGSVEADVPGVDCSASCTTEWDQGSAIVLDALPAEGQRFVRWSGACTGTNSCSLTLGAEQAVTALFAPERLPLTLSVLGRGSVTGPNVRCSVLRCVRSVSSYTTLRLVATAGSGWRFAGWTGACGRRAGACMVPMTRTTSVGARFVRRSAP